MKGIIVFIVIWLMVVVSPILAEQTSSESGKFTCSLPKPEQTDTADMISYMEFKLLLESGKIQTVNLISEPSGLDGSCFPDFFGDPYLGTIDGVYIKTDGKERTYITQRTSQASNDPFLVLKPA